MLRKIRIFLAASCFTLITLLFLDFTGTIYKGVGWLAKIQLIPALLALNVGVLVALLVLTVLFGRIYCSTICPLGVLQDIFSALAGKFRKNRFRFRPAWTWLRWGVLGIFAAGMFLGAGTLVAVLSPYSSYGRIASSFLAPIWAWGNNLLAAGAEQVDSYAFASTEIWLKGITTFSIAAGTLVLVTFLAWRFGRLYCNTLCPVGTVLGILSRWAIFQPRIQADICNGCGKCARNCKSSCIDPKSHQIDGSRCVACMDCLEICPQKAIAWTTFPTTSQPQPQPETSSMRRQFLTALSTVASSLFLTQAKPLQAAVREGIKFDGGLAKIVEKTAPKRVVPLVPPGSRDRRHFAQHCTGCQLCVSVCANQVLRPSEKGWTLLQPTMSYERGYCRPECVRCSEVCPTDAIRRLTRAEKSATQIGYAVWIRDLCVVETDGVKCGNCARNCPNQSIQMVPRDPQDPESLTIPAIDTERCLGCGACENLCPASPLSAIYVEGNERHREV
ncbi:MAG: 4Fe-4S dicluster domain-containing protein [Planctomycetia bacterium]|nr:4Fe-4S dicluster domain-containing protein [Planctomycetia bacterium]